MGDCGAWVSSFWWHDLKKPPKHRRNLLQIMPRTAGKDQKQDKTKGSMKSLARKQLR